MLKHSNQAILTPLKQLVKIVDREDYLVFLNGMIDFYKSVPTEEYFDIKDATPRDIATVGIAVQKVVFSSFPQNLECNDIYGLTEYIDDVSDEYTGLFPMYGEYYHKYISDGLSSSYISMLRADIPESLRNATREILKLNILNELKKNQEFMRIVAKRNELEKQLIKLINNNQNGKG